MKKRLKQALAAGALSTALVAGGAVSAQAIEFYVPSTNIWVTANQSAPRTFVITAKNGIFGAGKTVTIKIPKLFAAQFGDLAADDGVTWTTTTNAAGGIDPFTITVPADVQGTFTLTAETDDSTSVSSTFSVSNIGTILPTADTGGIDGATLGMWVGGAAVVLAGGALVVGGAGRSRREQLSI